MKAEIFQRRACWSPLSGSRLCAGAIPSSGRAGALPVASRQTWQGDDLKLSRPLASALMRACGVYRRLDIADARAGKRPDALGSMRWVQVLKGAS
jgi:hypothetical protein